MLAQYGCVLTHSYGHIITCRPAKESAKYFFEQGWRGLHCSRRKKKPAQPLCQLSAGRGHSCTRQAAFMAKAGL